MTATDTRLHGYDTFVDEVVDHLDVLSRVARRLTRQTQDAEDLVQETIARALARRAQFHPGTNLRAWLLTIERSLFVDAYRRARRGPLTQSLDEVEEGILYGKGGMVPSPSAESALWQEWMGQDLVAALETVPEHYRVAVLLSDVEGLSYAEMAQWMERQYTVNSNYNTQSDGTAITATQLPVKQSPRSGGAAYNISFAAGQPTASTFVLRAVPAGSMSGDACGTLTLDNTGARGSAGTTANCWDR